MKFGASLSAELKKKYGKRSLKPRVGDSVRIVRGEFKDVEGKVTRVDPKLGILNVEGVTREKIKAGTSPVPIDSSKVIVTDVVLDDKKRKQKLEAAR
ncbi:MAG: 50S ribosomal protein L24 [Thaumarchaeota archaeon]|nr:50S ribosomal protein L24 [Nitrososphaerota archaeon]